MVFLVISLQAFSQSSFRVEGIYKKNFETMPEMSSLVKMISYPVDYVTGAVNIKIPLYEVRCGSLTLPIYLVYNTGGVKVTDYAGWVGQGWQLIGVPVITRVPQGHLDRNLTCDFDENPNDVYQHAKRILSNDFYSGIDEEPDEYYYQLSDRNGMFLYVKNPVRPSDRFLSLPYDDVKIDTITGQKRFRLTDNHGVVYSFEGGVDSSYSPLMYETAWRASSMVSADGIDRIDFQYGNNTQVVINRHEDYITVIDQFSNEWNRSTSHSATNLPSGGYYDIEEALASPIIYHTTDKTVKSYQVSPTGQLYEDYQSIGDIVPFNITRDMRGNHVRQISFKGNTIVFDVEGSQPCKLKKITVKDSQGSVVKSFSFDYIIPSSYRYYLNEVKMEDSNGNTIERYQFQYYNPSTLPTPESRNYDLWGYYNGIGRNPNDPMVPRMNINVVTNQGDVTCYHGATLSIGSTDSRQADEQYMVYGSLKSITYPTGATDEFVYEANRVRLTNEDPDAEIHLTENLKGQNGIYQVGGLRIRQIKTLHNGSYVNFRTFTYGEDEDGTGCSPLVENGQYFTRLQTKYYINPNTHVESGDARYRVYSSSPVSPMTYENGAAVLYDKVTEYQGTPDHNSGKTVYRFAVRQTVQLPDPQLPITQPYVRYKDWQFGHLLSKTIFRRNELDTTQYDRISKEEYQYDNTSKYMGDIKACYYNLSSMTNISFPGDNIYYSPYRQLATYHVCAKLLTQKLTTQYLGTNRMETTTSYSYDNANDINLTEKTIARGEITRTEQYTYPSQLRDSTIYNNMYNRHILSPVVKTVYLPGNNMYLAVETPYTEYTAGQHTFYRPSALQHKYSLYRPVEQRLAHSYDDKGNLVQTVKDGRETETYLYGYDSQYPVAEIQNATYESVRQQLGTDFLNSLRLSPVMSDTQWTTLNGLRTLLPNAFITTYRYKPLTGMTSVIDPAGQETRYSYDSFGRLASKGIMHGNNLELMEEYQYHYKTE